MSVREGLPPITVDSNWPGTGLISPLKDNNKGAMVCTIGGLQWTGRRTWPPLKAIMMHKHRGTEKIRRSQKSAQCVHFNLIIAMFDNQKASACKA